jgi:rSAM/selenodomain-associated transferase 2
MVSVIVPVWNEAERLKSLLRWLLEQPGLSEIIVVDGGSPDATQQVVRGFPAVQLVSSRQGRGAQMNAGARRARGEVLLFLHADTRFPHGALDGLPALLRSRQADFGAFQIRFDPPVWLPQLLAHSTRIASPWCCFGDQGIFVRRDFFWRTGGYPEIPLLEDVHWVRRAGRMGKMVRSPHAVLSSARRFKEIGVVRQSLRNLSILIRDLLGQDPAKLAAIYNKGYARQKGNLGLTRERLPSPVTGSVAAARPTRILEL